MIHTEAARDQLLALLREQQGFPITVKEIAKLLPKQVRRLKVDCDGTEHWHHDQHYDIDLIACNGGYHEYRAPVIYGDVYRHLIILMRRGLCARDRLEDGRVYWRLISGFDSITNDQAATLQAMLANLE
jgi:hypothetical protein